MRRAGLGSGCIEGANHVTRICFVRHNSTPTPGKIPERASDFTRHRPAHIPGTWLGHLGYQCRLAGIPNWRGARRFRVMPSSLAASSVYRSQTTGQSRGCGAAGARIRVSQGRSFCGADRRQNMELLSASGTRQLRRSASLQARPLRTSGFGSWRNSNPLPRAFQSGLGRSAGGCTQGIPQPQQTLAGQGRHPGGMAGVGGKGR